MLDLIAALPPGSRVLDIGAATGSFQTSRRDLTVVRADLEIRKTRAHGSFVAADAARLPFANESFDLVVSNHSLEHFPRLEVALDEIGRTIKRDGAFYVAVPDATTFTDRLYRWMGRGGGHVNAFVSPEQVSNLVTRITGLPLRSTRPLWSSLSFLSAHNRSGRPQIKSVLFAFGHEGFLARFNWMLRWIDRRCRSRLSEYGWEFRFGKAAPIEGKPWINVCIRCGSGFAAAFVQMRTGWYRCPQCGARNLLFPVTPADRYE